MGSEMCIRDRREPATSQLLLGVPDGVDDPEVVVANTSDSVSRVSLRLVTAEATFTPADLEEVLVDPASVRRFSITKLLRSEVAEGLLGIVLAPLLHGSWGHLEANTPLVALLLFLVLLGDVRRGLAVTGVIWLVAGLGTWLVASPGTVHVGASGLVFGWLVYLVLRGWFAQRLGQVLLGALLFLAYGGLLWGVLPGQPGISWQGHLFGAVGGLVAARRLATRDERGARSPTPYGS